MKITNYDWNIRTSAEIRKKVLDGLMPLIEKNVMYERILLKPMQKMSLHSDLVRFLRKDAFTIYYGDKEVFHFFFHFLLFQLISFYIFLLNRSFHTLQH